MNTYPPQEKWVEARTVDTVGYLEEEEIVNVGRMGLATVHNVVQVRGIPDLFKALACSDDPDGKQLIGLGIPKINPKTKMPYVNKDTGMLLTPVEILMVTTSLSPESIAKGRLILFNLDFHSSYCPSSALPPQHAAADAFENVGDAPPPSPPPPPPAQDEAGADALLDS
jgi:hypothetical protein